MTIRVYACLFTIVGIELPQGWRIQSNDRTEEQVILAPDSPEFTTVKTKFIKGGIRSIKILNVSIYTK